MERELFRWVRRQLRRLGQRRTDPRQVYTDAAIVAVYFWAVINDRPCVWATHQANWPPGLRRGPLCSQSCLSRRLGTPGVRRILDRLESAVLARRAAMLGTGLVAMVDSKALPIGPHSHDRHANWGRASGGLAKGYRLGVLRSASGELLAWRVGPMAHDERQMARRMLRDSCPEGYVLADSNFDSNPLHDLVLEHKAQLVAPRKKGPKRGLAHGYHSPGRLRSRDLLENTVSRFGRDLLHERAGVERYFGHLTSTGGLLTHLPAWVRSYPRVRRWIQAKIVLAEIRATLRQLARGCA
jgi:hypothetical protein